MDIPQYRPQHLQSAKTGWPEHRDIRAASVKQVADILGSGLPRRGEKGYAAFEDLALVLGLISNLADWSSTDKMELVRIIRAKSGRDESQYARMLQRHTKLRRALINLGESAV